MNEGYAIFLNNDGTETKLSWDELKLEKNSKKYGYYMDIFGNVWVLITQYNRHFFSFMI